jgi:hypothetical protein
MTAAARVASASASQSSRDQVAIDGVERRGRVGWSMA